MSSLLTKEYHAVTGLFLNKRNKTYYSFIQNEETIEMHTLKEKTHESIYKNPLYPIWLIRHSLGISGSEEDVSDIDIESIAKSTERRKKEISRSVGTKGEIRDLFFRGLKVNVAERGYSHAVGPIHAGIIEPGHFRFSLEGEIIKHLTIRLGFQTRNILEQLKCRTPLQTIPMIEAVSSDTTIGYSLVLSNIYEESAGIKVSDEVKLIRLILLEIERVAIHIGDLGAMAGDIGYYPLQGLCATDRGVPLGAMEVLTGSRFGKGAIYPGEIRLNRKLTLQQLKNTAENLLLAFERVEEQFMRAVHSSTIRERFQGCGTITKEQVLENSFVGMPARCTGIRCDLRHSEYIYKIGRSPLTLELDANELKGDAWSRFYLRFMECKNSIEWLIRVIPEIDITKHPHSPLIIRDIKKFTPGVKFKSIEAWRGPVLIALDLASDGTINQAYLRDPSVLNWHALELAVRGEMVGDFPLNNKSFNLSYVGFDL